MDKEEEKSEGSEEEDSSEYEEYTDSEEEETGPRLKPVFVRKWVNTFTTKCDIHALQSRDWWFYGYVDLVIAEPA